MFPEPRLPPNQGQAPARPAFTSRPVSEGNDANGPSQDHMEIPSPLEVDSNAKENKIEKSPPKACVARSTPPARRWM
ncbi:hypothetical protein CEXT_241741 [Caerostris extrusa]|uniref:Uncharacterized protein n=1 Tax=Caerostris extrusa TaxID=172846 RepID=A0AAV4TCP7_CAEEX|nr:hypothetical protein CEXT_241741 [Caerostris extrusa]